MSKYFVIAVLGALLLLALVPTPAKADTAMDAFVFVPCQTFPYPSFPHVAFCGPQTSGPGEITWQAPASPTPTSVCLGGTGPGTGLDPVCFSITADVTSNGTDLGVQTLTFGCCSPGTYDKTWVTVQGNGCTGFPLQGNGCVYLGYGGTLPDFWTPPSSSPTFRTGSYIFFDDYDESGPPLSQTGTLNIFSATG